jgi:hypothetical protein
MAANPVVGVIQQFLHPPVGLCSLEAIAGGPYSGLNAFNRIRGPVNVDAFGIAWLITAAPDGYGLNIGASVNFYDRDVLSIGIVNRFFDASLNVTQTFDTSLVAGYVMFNESFPYVVDCLLQPFVEAEFSWVLLL